MPVCPNCGGTLHTVRQREGVFFHCRDCGGRAVTIPQIRRVAGDRFAIKVLRQINANEHFGERSCPFCTRMMRQFESLEPPLELDACKACGAVWFDPQEFEAVPEGFLESPEATRLRGIEAHATWRLEREKERDRGRSLTGDAPDDEWKAIPAFFGLPVESETSELSGRPWATWMTALLIAGASIAAFSNLRAAVDALGFIPAEAWRYGGLTFLTSFFLHGGLLHLAGNLYFFLIFGDNVEDYIGRWRYLLLLFGATLAGDVVHLLANPSSTVPCVGASGGISGVIVFYALQFPHARLGFMFRYWFRFQWVHMPAWFALILWLGLQSYTALMQWKGFSNVAATAHLGGAAAGFLFWLAWRKR